ncbi:MAG: M23 family metallopeptidase [Leptospirales bacterium]|jgi:murein DD-endopeptidase MepM/ murein hydrolase activator NlpD
MNRQNTRANFARSAAMIAALFCVVCNQSATFNKEFSVLSLEPRTTRVATERAAAFGWPVSAVLVSSGFGPRWGDEHKGLDLVAKTGTPIMASAAGVVVFAGYEPRGYGNLIVIEHDESTRTVYAHNRRNLVQKGQRVKQGQTIAFMGRTGLAFGTHLHFEYRVRGEALNPELYLDPLCAPTGGRWHRGRCEEIVAAR